MFLDADLTSIASRVSLPCDAVIDGQRLPAKDGRTARNLTPRDGSLLNEVAVCGRIEVDWAVASARAASAGWRARTPRARRSALLGLADLLESAANEFALLETLDTGKPISETLNVDIPLAIGTLRYYAEAIDKIYGEVGPTGQDKFSWSVQKPLGVIGAITPWNFPLHMAMWKVAPALAMGNAVVLKPAEQSPLTALRLGELALEAGLPGGLLNVIPGPGPETGSALSRHRDVDMIAFTGSGRVGRQLMRDSADSNLKRVSLELGGKSPHIILDDCSDLDLAVAAAAWGIFYNQGQVCTAGSRLILTEGIREAFLEKLLVYVSSIEPGDPLNPRTRLGALISETQLCDVIERVHGAVADGGTLLCGGARVHAESGGWYMAPTILDNVKNGDAIARQEVFGPVLAVITVADAKEALCVANDSDFGLAAGVWTADMLTAMHFARELETGLVWVNGWDSCDITMPFGGFKQSGFGRDRSLHALSKYADFKSITISIGDMA